MGTTRVTVRRPEELVEKADVAAEVTHRNRTETIVETLREYLGVAFLLTDDLRALPELQTVADAQVALSPIVLETLVKRSVLEDDEALRKLDDLTESETSLGHRSIGVQNDRPSEGWLPPIARDSYSAPRFRL